MDFSSSKPAEVPKQDLAGLMEAAQKDLFGYLETPPVTSDDSNHLKQILMPTTTRMFQCEFCINKYMQYGTYMAHRNAHFNINVHKCDFCEETFQNSYLLKRHIWIHWDNKNQPFPCVLKGCHMHCPTILSLKSHLKYTHRLSEYNVQKCKICLSSQLNPEAMLGHYYWDHVRNAPINGPVKNKLVNEPSSPESGLSNYVLPEYNSLFNCSQSLLNNGPSTNAPTKVPAQNQYVNEPPTSETGPLNPLIPENNLFLNVLKFLPTMNNAKLEESYPIQPSDSVLQISPEKGLHWVHRSEIAQINMPPIDPALVQNLLDQFRASNS
ncbi:Protein CBG07135 [Caenorhabditis briggsae]|uniref:Protein CBG07135 n=1 Tax=Caenorhabditis briggsae TaxID=6238 RepID=A8X3M6_CAEBR|nr:Protein CBG07135 [Caenorhabditis briggsae]CAP27236.1 Protein CBG07135 [Caenorhabditis briggsae]